MDTVQTTSELEGALMKSGFYLVAAKLSPDGYNHSMTINCSTPNREQELITIIEDQGWSSAVCTYHATPQEKSISIDDFQPYYWVTSVTPDIFHKL